MGNKRNRQRQSKLLKTFRNIHRTTAIFLFVFFLFISITGLLLGWKKNSAGLILPGSASGTSANLELWLPLDSLHKSACRFLHDSVSPELSTEIDRIDIRKEKGMVKFVFTRHYWCIQLDGVTGELLQVGKRRSDLIEDIHNGLILDKYFGTGREQIKLAYTNIMGLALLVFTVTGFWLWYGPKRMKNKKKPAKN